MVCLSVSYHFGQTPITLKHQSRILALTRLMRLTTDQSYHAIHRRRSCSCSHPFFTLHSTSNASGKNKTNQEYLRSLHRVLIRFHLGPAFSAERVGDVAMELYRECQCTLFALVTASASTTVVGDSRSAYDRASTAKLTGKQEGGGKSGEMSRRSRRRTRVHPAYATLVRKDDVGVFIGDDHKVPARGWRGRRGAETGRGAFVLLNCPRFGGFRYRSQH